tara:strand:+ start:1551 stop:2456 length:906 start_codon:yes stop_codon:yes gene_type:complete
MDGKIRSKFIVTAIGCLTVGCFLAAVNAEDKPGKTFTKTYDWPVKFSIKYQEIKPEGTPQTQVHPAVPQQKHEITQPFYPAFTKREQQIQTALHADTECDFPDVPLSKALRSLQEQSGINIYLNAVALKEEGLTVDEPINVSLSGIPFKSALDIILKPLGLTYVVDGEVLKITTQEEADHTFKVRIYPVGDLFPLRENYATFQEWEGAVQAFEEAIQIACLEITHPRQQKKVSAAGLRQEGVRTQNIQQRTLTIRLVPECKALVVNETDQVHTIILELFTQLRQVRKDQERQSSEKTDVLR